MITIRTVGVFAQFSGVNNRYFRCGSVDVKYTVELQCLGTITHQVFSVKPNPVSAVVVIFIHQVRPLDALC